MKKIMILMVILTTITLTTLAQISVEQTGRSVFGKMPTVSYTPGTLSLPSILSKIESKSRLSLNSLPCKDILTMTMIQGDPFLNLWVGNIPIRHIDEYKENEMVEIIDYDIENNSIECYTTSCYNAKNEILSQPNHEIVIQNNDLVPCIKTLQIDNITINDSKSIVANDVIIGTNGVVDISQSSVLEIYASGDVTLNNINCVSENSGLLVHSAGNVYVSNLTVSDKAKVEIEGKCISISPKTSLFNTNIKIIQL